MLITVGDLHLSEDREWSLKVSNEVVEDIIASPYNKIENTLILLGDLTEKASISGSVFSLIIKLFEGLRYKKIYVLKGNHDIKTVSSTGEISLVYSFLEVSTAYKHVEIIHDVKEIQIEGMDVLFLPHLHPTAHRSLKSYEDLKIDKEFFLIVGHFATTFDVSYPGELINVEHLKTKFWSFGHIHNPNKWYCGSYIPNSISEANQKRSIRVYSLAEGEEKIPIPALLEYVNIIFPQPLPVPVARNTVYTISNCNEEGIARKHYGNIYIRRCIPDASSNVEDLESLVEVQNISNGTTIKEYFGEYKLSKAEQGEVITLVEKYLGTILI